MVDLDDRAPRSSATGSIGETFAEALAPPAFASSNESLCGDQTPDTFALIGNLTSQDALPFHDTNLRSSQNHRPSSTSWSISPTDFSIASTYDAATVLPISQCNAQIPPTEGRQYPVAEPAAQATNASLSLFGPESNAPNQLFQSWGDFTNDGSSNDATTTNTNTYTVPDLGDDLNFNMFFGLDIPNANLPPGMTAASTANIFGGVGWDGWIDSTLGQSITAAQSQYRFCSPVTPEAADQPIIQYFVGNISHIAITRRVGIVDPRNKASLIMQLTTPNYYLGLFTASLFCPALYYGMLAWSAWHMGVVNDSSLPGRPGLLEYAEKKHQACCDHLFPNRDNIAGNNETELEAVYCALMVCGQFKVVTCMPTSQIRVVIDAIDKIHRRLGFSSSNSPLVQRMGSILSQYDVRSSLFGINEPVFTLRLGASLFEQSKTLATDQASYVGMVSVLHLHYLEAKCNDLERRLRDARSSADMAGFRRINREGDELFEHVSNLEPLFDPPRLAHHGRSIPDNAADKKAIATALSSISQDECYEMVLACTFHGVFIHASRILNYPTPPRNVDRAIGLALTVTCRNPEVVHSILAIPMFFAAVATADKTQVCCIPISDCRNADSKARKSDALDRLTKRRHFGNN